jgi:hypothetical protein
VLGSIPRVHALAMLMKTTTCLGVTPVGCALGTIVVVGTPTNYNYQCRPLQQLTDAAAASHLG